MDFGYNMIIWLPKFFTAEFYKIQHNTIQLFYCFISFHMRHSQNTFINMFNINTKNDISFSIMLNKRITEKRKYLFSYAERALYAECRNFATSLIVEPLELKR